MAKLVLDTNSMLPLRDVVFTTLREAILHGELAPGERLMEIHLANELGVSRTPIREAIRKLELEGLVIMTPRKGAVVASITEIDLRDVLEVRRVLEKLSMELACKRITQEELDQLKNEMAVFKRVVESGDISKIATEDVVFHDIIYHAAGNNRLVQMLNNLRDSLYRYRLEYIKHKTNHAQILKEHMQIVSTLENHDVEEGKKAIGEHIINQEKSILAKLKEERENEIIDAEKHSKK